MNTTSHSDSANNLIIQDTLTRSLDLLPDPIAIRTPDGHFLYANLALAKLSGLRSPYEIMGRVDYEIPSLLFEDEDVLDAWRDQDKNIVSSKRTLAMLEVHPGAVDSPLICRKVPFYNNNNECIGTFCTIKYLEVFSANDFVKGRLPGSLLLNRPDDFFTERECEIIFFKLQGMSSKEIAKILYLSPRTIENRMANMYLKAGVNHHDDFTAFCQKKNLHRYLPKRLMSNKRIGFSGDYEEDVTSE